MIQSPLNYTGGKYRLLSQILPLFPDDIETFVDLFCGGCNVGINVMANNHLYQVFIVKTKILIKGSEQRNEQFYEGIILLQRL